MATDYENLCVSLKPFFWYMIDALADRYPYERISQVTLDDLKTIHEDDILNYIAYLSEYTMKDENGQYLTKTNRNGKQEIITYSNSPAGKARKLATLKSFFKYMDVHQGFHHNPAIYIDLPKIKKRPIVALSLSEENRIETIVKEYGKIALPANVKVTAHILRKTFGTSLYNETGDVSLMQNALGHADSSTTTKFYIGFDPERLKKLRERKR